MGDSNKLNEYFRVLKDHLKCPIHHKKRFLSEAKAVAADFRQGNPDAAEDDIIDFLGDPRELAQTYLDTLDPQELTRFHKRNRWMRRGFSCAVALLICALSAWCFCLKTTLIEPKITATETLIIYRDYGGFL